MSKRTTIYIVGAFIAGVVLAPIGVNAAQRVFDVSMKVAGGENFGQTVYRVDDPDFQVKCWVSQGYNKGGISCLPWSEVKAQ
jgi:hypothetical protein